MLKPGWYPDPTGRHEFRYWRPGWSNKAADGPDEVEDPLRPRWRKVAGICLLVQLALMPFVGSLLLSKDQTPDSRVGVETGVDETAQIVYAGCSGERIRHIVLSRQGSKGSLSQILWSVVGDTSSSEPIEVGRDVSGMTTNKQLARPIGPTEDLTLIVATNQLPRPAPLRFNMADVPSTGALSYHDAYSDADTLQAGTHADSPCGLENSTTERNLAIVLVAEVLLAFIGLALLVLPRYAAPKPSRG